MTVFCCLSCTAVCRKVVSHASSAQLLTPLHVAVGAGRLHFANYFVYRVKMVGFGGALSDSDRFGCMLILVELTNYIILINVLRTRGPGRPEENRLCIRMCNERRKLLNTAFEWYHAVANDCCVHVCR